MATIEEIVAAEAEKVGALKMERHPSAPTAPLGRPVDRSKLDTRPILPDQGSVIPDVFDLMNRAGSAMVEGARGHNPPPFDSLLEQALFKGAKMFTNPAEGKAFEQTLLYDPLRAAAGVVTFPVSAAAALGDMVTLKRPADEVMLEVTGVAGAMDMARRIGGGHMSLEEAARSPISIALALFGPALIASGAVKGGAPKGSFESAEGIARNVGGVTPDQRIVQEFQQNAIRTAESLGLRNEDGSWKGTPEEIGHALIEAAAKRPVNLTTPAPPEPVRGTYVGAQKNGKGEVVAHYVRVGNRNASVSPDAVPTPPPVGSPVELPRAAVDAQTLAALGERRFGGVPKSGVSDFMDPIARKSDALNAESVKGARAEYPAAGSVVDGRKVRAEIPNMSSIAASVKNPTVLSGVREVPMADFNISGKHYSVEGDKRIGELVKEIAASKEITPLIVVIDKDGPYILEGSTRIDALKRLGAKSFPAKVVLEGEEIAAPLARADSATRQSTSKISSTRKETRADIQRTLQPGVPSGKPTGARYKPPLNEAEARIAYATRTPDTPQPAMLPEGIELPSEKQPYNWFWLNVGTPMNQVLNLARRVNEPSALEAMIKIIEGDVARRRDVALYDHQFGEILKGVPHKVITGKDQEALIDMTDGVPRKVLEARTDLDPRVKTAALAVKDHFEGFAQRIKVLMKDFGFEGDTETWGLADYVTHFFPGDYFVKDANGNLLHNAKSRIEALKWVRDDVKESGRSAAEYRFSKKQYLTPDAIRLGDRKYWTTIREIEKNIGNISQAEVKDALRGVVGRRSSRTKHAGPLMKRENAAAFTRNIAEAASFYHNQITSWEHRTRLMKQVEPMIQKINEAGHDHLARYLEQRLNETWGERSNDSVAIDDWLATAPGYRAAWNPTHLTDAFYKITGGRWDLTPRPFAWERTWGMMRNITAKGLLWTPRFLLAVNPLQPIQTLWPTVSTPEFFRGVNLWAKAEGQAILDRNGVRYDLTRYREGRVNARSKIEEIRAKMSRNLTGKILFSEARNQGIAYLTWYDKTRKVMDSVSDDVFGGYHMNMSAEAVKTTLPDGSLEMSYPVGMFTKIVARGKGVTKSAFGKDYQTIPESEKVWSVVTRHDMKPRFENRVEASGLTLADARAAAINAERPLLTNYKANRTAVVKGQLYTQFLPAVSDQRVLWGAGKNEIVKTATMFSRFQVKNLELAYGLLVNDRNIGGFGKWLGTQLVLGGTRQFLAWGALAKVFGAQRAAELPRDVHDKIEKMTGPATADFLTFGGLAPTLGIDLSYSTQLGDVPYASSVPELLGKMLLGPTGQLATSIGEAAFKDTGTTNSAAERAVREAVRRTPFLRIVEGIRKISTHDYDFRQADGQLDFKTDLYNTLLWTAGFRSLPIAERDLVINSLMEASKYKSDSTTAAAQAFINGDLPLMEKIVSYHNRTWVEVPISAADVLRRTRSRLKAADQDTLQRFLANAPRSLGNQQPADHEAMLLQWLTEPDEPRTPVEPPGPND